MGTTGYNAFNRPLKPLRIELGGEQYHLFARFLEIDLPMPTVTNLPLASNSTELKSDGHLVEFFEGMLLIEVQTLDDARDVCAYAIYGKYGEPILLTQLEANRHSDEFAAVFHKWAERLSGIELSVPDNLDIIRDVLFSTTESSMPIRESRTGIIEALLETHNNLQRQRGRC